MKKTYPLLLLLLISFTNTFCFGQHKAFYELYQPGDVLYVHALAGLSLRETANPTGKVLTVVKFGEHVSVLPFTIQVPFINSGIKGVWTKVQYGDFTGYQFSGFLSRYPKGDGAQADLYMKSIFKVSKTVTTPPDKRNYNMYEEAYFSNGVILVWSAPEGGSDISITFPETGFTFQEVYQFVKEVRKDFFLDNKCGYAEGELKCSGEYSSLAIQYAKAGDKFHPAPSIEVTIGDAD